MEETGAYLLEATEEEARTVSPAKMNKQETHQFERIRTFT
jgi:hypothetical protein